MAQKGLYAHMTELRQRMWNQKKKDDIKQIGVQGKWNFLCGRGKLEACGWDAKGVWGGLLVG